MLERDDTVTLRTDLRPGDIGTIVNLHGVIYAQEYGFDHTFEAYVAGPLSDFARSSAENERIWIAERDDRIIGCIAIVALSPEEAQLRWYLVDPSARGIGLGKQLLNESIVFCRSSGFKTVMLWTVSALTVSAHLYESVGFRKVEEKPGRKWGVDVIEEKYELELSPA